MFKPWAIHNVRSKSQNSDPIPSSPCSLLIIFTDHQPHPSTHSISNIYYTTTSKTVYVLTYP